MWRDVRRTSAEEIVVVPSFTVLRFHLVRTVRPIPTWLRDSVEISAQRRFRDPTEFRREERFTTVITVVCLPLLAVPHPIVATTAFFVLVLNTAGGVGDLYALWRFYRMPPGTLFYDINIDHMYVFEP